MQPRWLPERIVCLTEETTELLYLLGEQQRIVGISGFTVRPKQARKEKPKVSAFTSAKIDRILALQPDLVLGFSDMQADIAAELVRAGVQVHIYNQRSLEEIHAFIAHLGRTVGREADTLRWLEQTRQRMAAIAERMAGYPRRPRVYFEEWPDPKICGIRWVSELIGLAGGRDCFAEPARSAAAKGRILADDQPVLQARPDIIIGSWCGRKFRPEQVAARPGWDALPAVKTGQIFEIKSAEILQPGPACLTDGLDRLVHIIEQWQQSHG